MYRLMKKTNDCTIQVRATGVIWALFVYAMYLLPIIILLVYVIFITEVLLVILLAAIGAMIILIDLIVSVSRGIKIYKTRFIEIQNDTIKISKMAGKLKKRRKKYALEGELKYQCDKFLITDICKIGYSDEFYGHILDFHQEISHRGKYISFEMVFELVSGERITIDVSAFPKKKMKKVFTTVYEKTKVMPGKKLGEEFMFKIIT